MRNLSQKEKEIIVANRNDLHYHLSQLQSDFEDLSSSQLIFCRDVMLKRINTCLELILETDEDNLLD